MLSCGCGGLCLRMGIGLDPRRLCGLGKSNLMDAISFVLGVKTAELRGSHLKVEAFLGTVGKGLCEPHASPLLPAGPDLRRQCSKPSVLNRLCDCCPPFARGRRGVFEANVRLSRSAQHFLALPLSQARPVSVSQDHRKGRYYLQNQWKNDKLGGL